MKRAVVADATLRECAPAVCTLGFKEKIEIVKHLDRLCLDVIETAPLLNGLLDSVKYPYPRFNVGTMEEAVEAAKRSAARNGLSNCEFLCGDVLKVLDEMPALPDVIVVDPPRAGIHPKAMKKICGYGVKQIVYISCNPKTLVQNLVSAAEEGYEAVYAKPYDNFPMTNHVECVTLMTKK